MEENNKAILNTVLIGNPGVGKSTFLNGLLMQRKFESGIALGKGLTSVCQKEVDSCGNVFIDTPGLSDIKMRRQAAQEIKIALTNGGLFKIFFVITLEEGRIRPDDKTTMKLVLESAPIGSLYSIIINKLQPEIIEMLNDPKEKKEFLTLLNEELPPTSSVYLNSFDSTLSAKKNIIPQLAADFLEFVFNSPMLLISPSTVKEIKSDNFEAVKELLTRQLEQLKEDNQAMKQAFEKQQKKYKELAVQSIQQQQDLQKQFGAQLDQIKSNYDQQLNEVRKNAKPAKGGLFSTVGKFLDSIF